MTRNEEVRQVLLNGIWSIEEEAYFSFFPCDCCRSSKGGKRYDGYGYLRPEEAKNHPNENLIGFSLCEDCILEYTQ